MKEVKRKRGQGKTLNRSTDVPCEDPVIRALKIFLEVYF